MASNIGATWLKDVPRLLLDWSSDSPLMKILEFFLFSPAGSSFITGLSFEHLPVVLAVLPPGGRPLILALAIIHQLVQQQNQRVLQQSVKRLAAYQAPNGAWCDDILITALCSLCLYSTGQYPAHLSAGLKWLNSVQYASGSWPSFHQLTNWDIGLASYVGHTTGALPPPLLAECREFLKIRAYQDGSYGTVAPLYLPGPG